MVTASSSLARNKEWEWQPDLPTRQTVENPRRVTRVYTRTKPLPKLLVKLSLLFFIYAMVFVFFCIKISVLGYQIIGLEKDISDFENANYRIEYQIAQMNSLEHIEQVAAQQLGMIKRDQNFKIVMPTVALNPGMAADADSVAMEEENKVLRKIYNNLVLLADKNF